MSVIRPGRISDSMSIVELQSLLVEASETSYARISSRFLKGFALMRRKEFSVVFSVALAMASMGMSGCKNGWFCRPKGPMNLQQANAVVHDPFPQNDIAPYEAASRPPDYSTPLPEPTRNRLVPDAMPWLGR